MLDNKKIDPFEKCRNCGHTYSDHYDLLPLREGEAPTPKHTVGVCSKKGCNCEKFVGQ